MTVKKLIAGNWKMFGDADMAENFDNAMAKTLKNNIHVEWLICPSFPYIASLSNLQRGAQDCSAQGHGAAYTGEVSAVMLKEMSVNYCIVGHSERRTHHGEGNATIKQKAKRLIEQGIKPIICVGETEDERENGDAFDVVKRQLSESIPDSSTADNTVIAYEPVWAIGTGKAATLCDVVKMHAMIHDHLKSTLAQGVEMRILYGGSVKPDNAKELLNAEHVNGALIGGASLKPEDFIAVGMAVNKED